MGDYFMYFAGRGLDRVSAIDYIPGVGETYYSLAKERTMVTETNLLKVKTLSKSHAAQIEVIELDKDPTSRFQILQTALNPEAPGSAAIAVQGWIDGLTLRDSRKVFKAAVNASYKYWLVFDKTLNRLSWILAPRPDSEAGKFYANLPQLFL